MENRYQEGYALPEDWLLEIAAMRTRLAQQHDQNARLLDQLSNAVAETLRRRYAPAKGKTKGGSPAPTSEPLAING